MKMMATIYDENDNELVTRRVTSLESAFMIAEVLKSEAKRIEICSFVKNLFNEEVSYPVGNYIKDVETNKWFTVSTVANLAEKYFSGGMR